MPSNMEIKTNLRYYAIVKPMLYPFKITSTRTVELICCSWVLAILLTIPPFFGWSRFVFHKSKLGCMVDWRHHRSYAAVYVIVGAVFPTAVIIVCYHHIFKAARISSRRVSNGNIVETGSRPRRRSRRASLLVSIRMNSPTKALRTILLTLIITFIFWLPFVFNGLIEIAYKSIEIPVFIHSVIVILLCCTFLVQPCIYGLWNKTIRRQIKSVIFGTSISFDGEDERMFYQRRQSRGASITGSITDLSYTALLQSRPGVATISGCSVHQSSNDSGAVLACIQEADDSDKSLNNSLNTSKTPTLTHSTKIMKQDHSTSWKKDLSARHHPGVQTGARQHPRLHHVDANSVDEGIDDILETVNLDD
ncbi:G-protein coupled receptor 161-like isoform X2 [Anneissia japonica]|uniref:G-protein coupled receptor 161-like isoform X2 n=1 Tax=Anneissia japonica TaxID=1529436 RepID=UPI0014257759|nr:G-protein coupled receptor 161-like isoform X2 [Anneissia japonica]